MTENRRAKIAVVGVGIMGSNHLRSIHDLDNTELVAVCDIDRDRADKKAAQHDTVAYYDHRDLLDHDGLDGIIVSTPHYDHTPIAIDALSRDIHVLVEKPIAVHTKDAQRMIEAYEAAKAKNPELVFAAVFNQRTYGFWQKILSMIQEGELGKLVRATWVITNWFRPQIYYDNGGWRATWKGEGGGVLLNQCPHNLDLYQWFVGMPTRVTAFASIGKYHRIEVEDEVTAYLEHENGMVGHFIATTAESPGTDRLEIVGENGKLLFEDRKLTFYRNDMSMLQKIETAKGMFEMTKHERVDVPYEFHGQPGHKIIIDNFADVILGRADLIAPAPEGIHSVTLANAILLSSFRKEAVDVPIDADAYEEKLQELIRGSTFQKPRETSEAGDDPEASFKL